MRGAVCSAIATACLAVCVSSSSCAADPQRALRYDQPGRLVRLPDGRRINLRCVGAGRPTVLFESGWGATSQAWSLVQPIVARSVRACAYDRAGYGFSDPGPSPRDGEAVARDLDATLRAAGEGGPYLLVGHSAGGLYMRIFAARRHRQVVGMVLVDPTVEHQESRLAAVFGPGAGSLAPIRAQVAGCLDAPGKAAVLAPSDCAPQAQLRTELSELDNLSGRTSDQVDRASLVIQDVPAIVLTATQRSAEGRPAGSAMEPLHRQLASRFWAGAQESVVSSHLMMIDKPDVVSGAILRLARGRNPAAEPARPIRAEPVGALAGDAES